VGVFQRKRQPQQKLRYPEAVIYEFSETGIEKVSYRDSQPYQMTSRFLKNPEAMLEKLLGD